MRSRSTKKVLLTAIASSTALVLCGVAANAAPFQEIDLPASAAHLVGTVPFGAGAGGTLVTPVVTAGATYSNVTTFTGFGITNGGATLTSTVKSTRILMDDIQTNTTDSVEQIGQFSWSIANFNATATSARMRIRFYQPDGPGGSPGTAFGGFSFAVSALPTGVSTFFTTLTPGQLPLPMTNGKFWAGEFFDNSGASATTNAALNNLGQGTFNPPDVGSSADQDWLSTNTDAASGFLVNNPTGSTRNSPFAANPVASYGWEFVPLPEPTTIGLAGLGLLGLASRRRRA